MTERFYSRDEVIKYGQRHVWQGHGHWLRTPDGHPGQISSGTDPGQDPGSWRSTED